MKKNYLNLSFLLYFSLFLMVIIFNPRNLSAEEISDPRNVGISTSPTAKYINGSDTTFYPLQCGYVLSLPPGGSISFGVTMGAMSISSYCTVRADSLPPGATFPPAGGPMFASSVFNWTPEIAFIGTVRFLGNSVGNDFICDVSFEWPSPVRINLSVIPEGIYYPLFNQLSRRDTISAFLRDVISPFTIRDSAKCVIDSTTLSGGLTFFNVVSGTYYLVVKHFNSIETWSKTGGENIIINGSIYEYDFTSSISQASSSPNSFFLN